MPVKSHKPSGVVPWPLVLVEGGEKVGKSYSALSLSTSDKVGPTWVIDLGEGTAEEYGAIPGADYEVCEHDGTWKDILARVGEVRGEAQRAHAANEPPVVLVIDSMTAEWSMLSDWANQRARRTETNQKKLAKNPDADITVSMNFWNDAATRHRKLMTMLLTFPGIVVITARGKEVAEVDDNGKPSGDKSYKVEGHKTLAFDASAWVRLSRDHPPLVVGMRSVKHGVRPGVDKPKPAPNFTLEWLVFDVLGCDPRRATARDVKPLDGGELTADERGVDSAAEELKAAKAAVWELAQAVGIKDAAALTADYAKYNDGKALAKATVEELGQYATELGQALDASRQSVA